MITLTASNDKRTVLDELLKDFSIKGNPRIAGRHREKVAAFPPALTRSSITETWGGQSCGKTSLMHRVLAHATDHGEICALVDASDAFDPMSGQSCGIHLDKLLWIRCGRKIETALKAADILLQGGGFGLVTLDIGNMNPATVRKIPMMYWYRFRRAVEIIPAAFLVLASGHVTGSCASLVANVQRHVTWSGSAQFRTVQNTRLHVTLTRSGVDYPTVVDCSDAGLRVAGS